MAKKNDGFLNRKQRKQYSKLIAAKLEGLGVKDIITMQSTRIQKTFVDANGKEMFKGIMHIAQNVQRGLIRKIRMMPKAAVLKFLATKAEPKKQ